MTKKGVYMKKNIFIAVCAAAILISTMVFLYSGTNAEQPAVQDPIGSKLDDIISTQHSIMNQLEDLKSQLNIIEIKISR